MTVRSGRDKVDSCGAPRETFGLMIRWSSRDCLGRVFASSVVRWPFLAEPLSWLGKLTFSVEP